MWIRFAMQNAQARSALITVLALVVLGIPDVSAQKTPLSAPAQQLRREIMAGDVQGASHGDLARYRAALLRIYSDSSASALWLTQGKLTRQGELLLAELRAAEMRGLRASDYDAEPLARRLTGDAAGGVEPLRTDAWLTLSAIRFADHLHRGRVDPRTLRFALPSTHERHDVASIAAALSRAPDVRVMLDSLEPAFARFRALKELLPRYRILAADRTLTEPPSSASTIRPGQAWAGTTSLRRLLTALGDIADTTVRSSRPDSLRFDDVLVDGVKRFQRRHGLVDDGNLGAATLAQLRVPLDRRVAQIELAMERWRWLPDLTSPRFVVVNIPAFRLYAFDRAAMSQQPVERMDVIVGSAYRSRHTPVFTGEMRFVVFHPYWDVPPSIARNEEIPRIRRNPGYAEREGLEIVRGGDVGATVYPMTGANLQRVAAGTLRLRQRPGPRNALGAVKFVFPNQFNVYLHGTPAQSLFARTRRDFSHGCIRTSDPARLAEFVLRGQQGWDRARIETAMYGTDGLQRVALERSLPVYILYVTVVTDDHGTPLFYPDIYGHDAVLARALQLREPPRLLADHRALHGTLPYAAAGDCPTANE